MQLCRCSRPRRVAGYLTVLQLSNALAVPRHWLYDRIYNVTIQIRADAQSGLYLFPDKPATLKQLHQLRTQWNSSIPCVF